jgi:hypothetical protein
MLAVVGFGQAMHLECKLEHQDADNAKDQYQNHAKQCQLAPSQLHRDLAHQSIGNAQLLIHTV